jgi:peptidoglycan/xylan/chitin deacetylase (PgdA/CDA1 family)
MIIKKISSLTASIINLFIFLIILTFNSNAQENNTRYFSNDEGVLSIMYHRFNEFKYPSTNISMDIFKEHIDLILDANLTFYHPKDFVNEFDVPKKEKKVLLTVDDAFQSFYDNAWPYLKKNQIPFILFVSTEPVGNNGYMNWDQIKEIERSKFGVIGHHSHSHDYLIDKTEEVFLNDIKTSNLIFNEKLGYVPTLFSYPFGEYSGFMRDYISRNFRIAFGQHSGIIDVNKNRFELPRFPINEKYGEIKRFKSIINYYPLEYRSLEPEEKKLSKENNPPKFKVKFFDNQKNIENINCYSNEGNKWMKSNIKLLKKELTIEFREPFLPRRGRINCSVNDNGKWRWFGTQFIIR